MFNHHIASIYSQHQQQVQHNTRAQSKEAKKHALTTSKNISLKNGSLQEKPIKMAGLYQRQSKNIQNNNSSSNKPKLPEKTVKKSKSVNYNIFVENPSKHAEYFSNSSSKTEVESTSDYQIFNDSISSAMDISKVIQCEEEKEIPSKQLDATFRNDVYIYSLHKEATTRPEHYIKRQKEIKPDMRTVLIDWLIEVSFSSATYMCSDVIPLAVNYLDRFLSKMGVPRAKFQLLGIVSLMVASKMTDTIPPDTNIMSELTDNTYSSSQIKKMEHILLEQLDFDLYPPVPSMFFSHYLYVSQAQPDIDETPHYHYSQPSGISKRTYSSLFTHFLTEIITLDYRLSVSWLVSRTSLCTVLMLRLITKNILTSKPFSREIKFKPSHFQSFLTQEETFIQDVKTHGVLSPGLLALVEAEFPNDVDKENIDPLSKTNIIGTELKTAMVGIRTLWSGVIKQDSSRPDSCLATIEKYNRSQISHTFPDLPKLCQQCIPMVEDIERCF